MFLCSWKYSEMWWISNAKEKHILPYKNAFKLSKSTNPTGIPRVRCFWWRSLCPPPWQSYKDRLRGKFWRISVGSRYLYSTPRMYRWTPGDRHCPSHYLCLHHCCTLQQIVFIFLHPHCMVYWIHQLKQSFHFNLTGESIQYIILYTYLQHFNLAEEFTV
jgi:hypothetical protein